MAPITVAKGALRAHDGSRSRLPHPTDSAPRDGGDGGNDAVRTAPSTPTLTGKDCGAPALADDVAASVEAAMAAWKSAYDPRPSPSSGKKKRRRTATDESSDPSSADEGAERGRRGTAEARTTTAPEEDEQDEGGDNDDDESTLFGPEAYRRRLVTFRTETYFAKPLALSPLVCASFGWENQGRDLLRCLHPRCGGAVCVSFRGGGGGLARSSFDGLCRTYLGMLASSHAPRTGGKRRRDGGWNEEREACPFRSYAERWTNAATRGRSRRSGSGAESAEDFYVPPYLLTLSDGFLRFEDRSNDGSPTWDSVTKDSLKLRDRLRSEFGAGADVDVERSFAVEAPEVVEAYAHEIVVKEDGAAAVAALYDGICSNNYDGTMKAALLLSTFGWSFYEYQGVRDAGAGNPAERRVGCAVQCGLCLAQAWLATPSPVGTDGDGVTAISEDARGSDPNPLPAVRLIRSHRPHCPYVAGFASADATPVGPPTSSSPRPGWKVVVSNLAKHCHRRQTDSGGTAPDALLTEESLRGKIRACAS